MGSSTLLTELSLRHGFYLVPVVGMANIHVTWLVYVHTYCVPIATLNQNKPSRLLYLGHAQITRIAESEFNWAAEGDFSWGWGYYTPSGHHITLSLNIAWHSISCDVHTHYSYRQREICGHVLEGKKLIKRFKLQHKVKKDYTKYSSWHLLKETMKKHNTLASKAIFA